MKNLDRIDQGIEVEIETIEKVEIVEEVVMIGIVEVLVDHQIEVVMIGGVIEIIQGIGMVEEIDIVEKDQGHLEIIILEDIEVEVIQVQDIKMVDNLLRNVLSVVEQDIQLKSVGTFKKYLEKIGKQLTKVKDNPLSKRRNDEDSSDKAFVIQSVNSLLEDLGLGIESTNY